LADDSLQFFGFLQERLYSRLLEHFGGHNDFQPIGGLVYFFFDDAYLGDESALLRDLQVAR